MDRRTLGTILIAVGFVGVIGIAWSFAAGPGTVGPGSRGWAPLMGARPGASCSAPALPGRTVDVVLSDMGCMMAGCRMMSVTVSPSTVPAGDVSFRVWNAGMMVHELVVLPLPPGGAGTRPVGSDGTVSEAGSLGEASRSCAEGQARASLPDRSVGSPCSSITGATS